MAPMSAVRPQQSTRFIYRSYLSHVFTPQPPIAEWLVEIDRQVRESGDFFAGRPIVLDLSAVSLSSYAIVHLVGELEKRGVRVMGLENVDPSQVGAGMPPLLRASKSTSTRGDNGDAAPANERRESSLLLDEPIRSGQAVVFPDGDVTVLGSVSSGAELVAGGSIHIYGTLRGRAMAGANGNARARIFCSRIEAELVAVSGYYLTADSIDPGLRNRPVQIWLEGKAIKIAALI
jgi:septum site-determining protein MinC